MENAQKLTDIIDSKLLSERKVFLWGQVDDDSAKHVIPSVIPRFYRAR
jgi:ATP-dependent Clp protease protease subunit